MWRVIRLPRRRRPMGAVGLLLLLVLLLVVLLVLGSLVRVRVAGIRLGRLLLLLAIGVGLLLRGVGGGMLLLLLLLLLGVGIGLLLLRGVGGGDCLLLVGRVGLLVGRVHLRLVLLLVGVLRLGGRGRGVVGGQHRGTLRLHLDGGVVSRGLLVLLVPEAVGVTVEDEGGDEEKPGEASVGERILVALLGTAAYHCRALRPAMALMMARPVSVATATRLAMVQWWALTALPSS